jgi:hypothetical protein
MHYDEFQKINMHSPRCRVDRVQLGGVGGSRWAISNVCAGNWRSIRPLPSSTQSATKIGATQESNSGPLPGPVSRRENHTTRPAAHTILFEICYETGVFHSSLFDCGSATPIPSCFSKCPLPQHPSQCNLLLHVPLHSVRQRPLHSIEELCDSWRQ